MSVQIDDLSALPSPAPGGGRGEGDGRWGLGASSPVRVVDAESTTVPEEALERALRPKQLANQGARTARDFYPSRSGSA